MRLKIASIILAVVSAFPFVFIFGCADDKTTYTVNFVIGNENVMNINVNHGEKISPPQIEEREEYVFKCWYTDENYDYKWNFGDSVTSSMTLYGYYVLEKEETFNVLFKDGDNNLLVSKVSKGALCEPYIPQKDGYEFCEWQSNGITYSFNEPVTEDLILSAVWEVKIYTVSFVAGDRTLIRTFTIENMEVSPPEVPLKEHYTGKWENFVLELKDITVNAVYTPIVYTAEFIADSVTIQKTEYTVEDIITSPAIPEKLGYTGEWSETPLGGNVTVNAKYTPIVYTVTFMVAGNVVGYDTYTVEDREITYPEIPPKEGYFGYWQEKEITYGDILISAFYEIAE